MVRKVPGKEPGRQHQRMLLAKVYAITQSAMPNDPIAEAERVQSIVANFEDEWA